MAVPSDETLRNAAEASQAPAEKPREHGLPEDRGGATLSLAASAFGRALLAEFARWAHRLRDAGASIVRRTGIRLTNSLKKMHWRARARPSRSRAPSNKPSVNEASGFARSSPRERPRSRSRRLLKLAAAVTVVAVVAVSVATAGIVLWAVRDMPLADILPPLEEPRLEVVTADGETLYTRGAYRAAYVPLPVLPETLVEAVISVEDRRYFSHGGIDIRGIARAAVENLRRRGIAQGGSTISQQLVKVLYLSPERSLQRKLQEMVLAIALEHQLGKDRILELYLNSVYLGSGAWGAPAAAEVYFGHDISELSLAEAATLAAAIRAPSEVNLLADPPAARARAALVLRLMHEQGRIPAGALADAEAELASLEATPPASRGGSYYVDWVLEEAQELSEVVDGRITVTATIDPVLQMEAERVVAEIMSGPGRAAGATQAALVAMTPEGHVRAMVGGLDYTQSQFNRATDAMRQPGSTFKLPVYLAALVMGLTPETAISDAPIEIDGWSPRNYGGGNSGQVTLTEAFARSLNAATVRLAEAIGTDNIIAVARQLGIESPLAEGLSLALGTSEVTLLDITEAYASILAGRLPVEATGVASLSVGESGTMLTIPTSGPEAVQMTRTRQPMLDMLRAVITSGTGRDASLPGFVAGKTGTSQENRDAWFVGFSETLVVGVWVGNDDASPMDGVTGGGIPVDIWRAVMEAAQQSIPGAPTARAAPAPVAASTAPVECNIRACSRAYRSFRASDCTFQPYRGGRKICTR